MFISPYLAGKSNLSITSRENKLVYFSNESVLFSVVNETSVSWGGIGTSCAIFINPHSTRFLFLSFPLDFSDDNDATATRDIGKWLEEKHVSPKCYPH